MKNDPFQGMPAVSVVVPVYNVERYIGGTIRSVLGQSFEDLELMLVDDGSTDGSARICASFARVDPRVKVLKQQNRGLAGARNTGIRHATGMYVAFLDGDDLWASAKLERHVAHLERRPRVGVSFCHSALVDETGRLLGKYQTPPAGLVTPEQLLLTNPLSNGSTTVIRRETLEAVAVQQGHDGAAKSYFDEHFSKAQGVEDLDCWLRIAVLTPWEIECLPEVLTYYRLNTSGLSVRGEAMLSSWEIMLEKARGYAPDLVAHVERPARAYLLRYLASRAVWGRDGRLAVRLIHRTLQNDASLLWRRARATWLTLLAAYALRLLPSTIYGRLEEAALRLERVLRRKRFQHVHVTREVSADSSTVGTE